MIPDAGRWPRLELADWADTCATLHMWTQIVGKIRLALASPINHWWHVTLYATARGLTTSPMPYRGGTVEILFDFVEHRLVFETSDGGRKVLPLEPESVAAFYARVRRTLDELRVAAHIWPMPVEVPSPVRFDEDRQHASYDAAAVERWWRTLRQVDVALKAFRGGFLGKCSPVHFFWGSFDLALTRFSGRPAPPRAGADRITSEAYSHEVASAGFWPGTPGVVDAAFYAYAAPEPPGYAGAPVAPAGARYDRTLNEFILPYEEVRSAASPEAAIRAFLDSTYEAAAALGRWDRAQLERR
ncbi:MAG: DUF5996 family protein [Betaproteobacteria bacterium]